MAPSLEPEQRSRFERRERYQVEPVEANYIQRVPSDPSTRRNDTWIESREAGTGRKSVGIVDVHSGATGTASDGTKYAEW